jgi:LuxR family maltose regulon positive regulatory protein
MIDVTEITNFYDGPLAAGSRALESGAWEEAEGLFRSALAVQATPEGWEGLGLALWWLNRLDAAFEARERAYPLYRSAGDRRSAARVALWLAWDYLGVRGQMAVANGWLGRAHSLLDDLQPCSEHGWLALREAENAILWAEDPVTARKLAVRGTEIGRALGLIDMEMYGLALEGFAMVSEGEVNDGMRRLDEATMAAIGGEMNNRTAIGSTCCCLIFACERVFDYDRAMQWCIRLKEYCERIAYVPMLGVCRSHHAGVLIWSGAWGEAELELTEAARTLQATRPAFVAEAVARLGYLRYRQGRLDEAVSLFEQVLFFPSAQLGLGWLALDLGEAQTALDHAERYLRRIPRENRTERVRGLELIARANLSLGNLTEAQGALDELMEIAGRVGTGPLLAIANFSAGVAASTTGDHESARSLLEDAVDLFGRSGAPFEMGQARIALAMSLEALGRLPSAEREAQAALIAFRELGAERQVARAEAVLGHIRHLRGDALQGVPIQQPNREAGPELLSPRQKEVLRLIAQGLGDAEIADKLTLSRHTVHRHVTNILTRLDVRSRAAAIAYAARENLL